MGEEESASDIQIVDRRLAWQTSGPVTKGRKPSLVTSSFLLSLGKVAIFDCTTMLQVFYFVGNHFISLLYLRHLKIESREGCMMILGQSNYAH